MKKIILTFLVFALMLLVLASCSSQKWNPLKSQTVPQVPMDTLFITDASAYPDSGGAPLLVEFYAYGAYKVFPRDTSVHIDPVIILTGEFSYLWNFYLSGETLSTEQNFQYTFEDTGMYVITCMVTDLKTDDSITRFLKIRVTGAVGPPEAIKWCDSVYLAVSPPNNRADDTINVGHNMWFYVWVLVVREFPPPTMLSVGFLHPDYEVNIALPDPKTDRPDTSWVYVGYLEMEPRQATFMTMQKGGSNGGVGKILCKADKIIAICGSSIPQFPGSGSYKILSIFSD